MPFTVVAVTFPSTTLATATETATSAAVAAFALLHFSSIRHCILHLFSVFQFVLRKLHLLNARRRRDSSIRTPRILCPVMEELVFFGKIHFSFLRNH
jgi:hypothetical protein